MSEETQGQGTDPVQTPEPPTDFREYTAWRESGETPKKEEGAAAPVDTEPQPAKEASESQEDAGDDDGMIEVPAHKRHRPGQRERMLGRLEAENEYLRQGMAALQQQAPAGQPPQRETPDPSQPKFEDYDDVVQYNIAVAKWVYQKEDEARAQQQQMAAAWQHEQSLKAKWAQATETSQKAHPDYEEVVQAIPKVQGPVVNVIRQALLEEENGPEVLYYLGKHPDEVQRLLGMSPINATKEIGKLSVKLAVNGADSEKPKPVAAPQRLLPPVTRSAGSAPIQITDPKVEADYKTWAKMRMAQLRDR